MINQVSALRLYGSRARQDADQHSDVDVLVVYSGSPHEIARASLLASIRDQFGTTADVAEYEEGRINAYFASGHLFAWHLFYESVPLEPDKGNDYLFRLGKPSEYRTAIADLYRFAGMLQSIPKSVVASPRNAVFEAGITYLIARNIGMIASAELLPQVDFSRYAPLRVAAELGIVFPVDQSTYQILINCRHASRRGSAAPNVCALQVEKAATALLSWTSAVLGRIERASNA